MNQPAKPATAHGARQQAPSGSEGDPDADPRTPAQTLPQRARAFSAALLADVLLDSGEPALQHADAVQAILASIGADEATRAAAWLSLAAAQLSKPEDQLSKVFGRDNARLALESRKLMGVFTLARQGGSADSSTRHREMLRRLLLAMSEDLRVIPLRLASRLQSLRYFTLAGRGAPEDFVQTSLQIWAPLANRLGLWQMKWEIEDLAFRLDRPGEYARIADWMHRRGAEHEALLAQAGARVREALAAQGIEASVSGRRKHAYSIWRKMQGKSLELDQVMDLLALRIVVDTVDQCYAALGLVHEIWSPLEAEYDDYIARPKANGYQSLHTVVRGPRELPLEVQIRTHAMHEHAEQGVAAHWAYKEAGAQGYKGVVAASDFDAKVALARQLLAWRGELAGEAGGAQAAPAAANPFDDRVYVLTPQARILELESGSTAVDFAYAVHTDLGHRCRGARVDGALLPLNTPLRSGQTVEIVAAKQGGPSRDWLNPELGFLRSARARAKVRAWFNAQELEQTTANGRAQVERLLQREGRSGMSLHELASGLGLRSPEHLFERVGSENLPLRQVETFLRGGEGTESGGEELELRTAKAQPGGVLVVGVDALLTQLAGCCKPAPPDAICGFVTRGRGVSVHRADCSNARKLRQRHPERVIPVTWGARDSGVYAVDLMVEAADRHGLLRDISEVFSKQKLNVIGVRTQSRGDTAHMLFTVELPGLEALSSALAQLREVRGVRLARRR